jgi:hypothetical protein
MNNCRMQRQNLDDGTKPTRQVSAKRVLENEILHGANL